MQTNLGMTYKLLLHLDWCVKLYKCVTEEKVIENVQSFQCYLLQVSVCDVSLWWNIQFSYLESQPETGTQNFQDILHNFVAHLQTNSLHLSQDSKLKKRQLPWKESIYIFQSEDVS